MSITIAKIISKICLILIHRIEFIDTETSTVYKKLRLERHRYILREKSLAIYFEDSQFRRNMTFNFIVSNIYVDKRSRVR